MWHTGTFSSKERTMFDSLSANKSNPIDMPLSLTIKRSLLLLFDEVLPLLLVHLGDDDDNGWLNMIEEKKKNQQELLDHFFAQRQYHVNIDLFE